MTERHQGTRKSTLERLARAALSPEENAVRKAILTAFADKGSAPNVHEVAHTLALPVEEVLEGFRKLAAYDLIVWKEDEARTLSAYPFSGVPTAHQVFIDGGAPLYAMCAIDALGIPFMLGHGARIRSACFFCRGAVRVEIRGGLLRGAEPSTLVVWSSKREGCCVAEVRCPLMNFFCDARHLQQWLTTSQERGTALNLLEAIEVGKAAFGELLR